MNKQIRLRSHKGWFIAFVTNSNLVGVGRTPYDADCKARQALSGINVPWPPNPPRHAA